MVVVRLARGGSRNLPFYHIVATDSRSRRDSNFIEKLGFFNPRAKENAEAFRLDNDRIKHWVDVGAKLSPTVKNLIKIHKANA